MRLSTGALLFSLAIITAMATAQSVSTLPDGQKSTMGSQGNRLRASFALMPLPMPPMRYHPVQSCTFVETLYLLGLFPVSMNAEWSVKPAGKNRFMVVAVEGKDTSTALIGPDGTLYDYNDNSGGDSYTPENAREKDAKIKDKFKDKNAPHVLNVSSVRTPHFIGGKHSVGDTVALMLGEEGYLWGRAVYRGATEWHGEKAILLDLIRTQENSDLGDVVVGFMVFDPQTMLPDYAEFHAGTNARLEKTSCQP